MDNIKEGNLAFLNLVESDDWGTPTPGRLALDRTYTYHNPENVLMDNIPIRSVRSCFEHDTSKLVIKVEPNKSESLTSRQIKPIEEKVNIEENKEENTSLNESDFDNYESVSSGKKIV